MPLWECDWHRPIESDERYGTAVHEAGHCAAYLHFQWRFDHISIEKIGRSMGRIGSACQHQGDYRYPAMLLAGPAAEARYTRHDLAHIAVRSGRGDVLKALEAVAQLDKPVSWPALAKWTRQLVEAEWLRIGLVARDLVEKKRLSYDQVLALVGK